MHKVRAEKNQHCTSLGTKAHEELDNQADTFHRRTIFWLHKLTGKSCSVYMFSASYDPMQDVKISTFLTSYTDEYGRTWIIVFNEILWFGTIMDHSLINPKIK